MMLINATALDRKSGGAQWRDLRFSGPFLEMFFDSERVRAVGTTNSSGGTNREGRGCKYL